MVDSIPQGYRTITPSFTFKDSQKAIDFYRKAFDAKTLDLMPNLNGKGVMHATLRIGDSIIMMGDENPEQKCLSAETMGGSPISFYLYVPNADDAFQKAVAAGCAAVMPVTDMFWGDRAGSVRDPFGYSWMVATHAKDLTKEEIRRGAEAFFAQWSEKNKG